MKISSSSVNLKAVFFLHLYKHNNLASKIAIILWISLILLTVFVLAHYLLFAIIMVLSSVLAISTLTAIGYSSGNGGHVHVRGYYRKESYVRSPNRRRPRHLFKS